ncbi:hypothetical protein AGMMS49579_26500 [Spirochaetia bacterium]|nr:hypothetical protein AGMMS49579_26500 [Spirochaetia bacterium]
MLNSIKILLMTLFIVISLLTGCHKDNQKITGMIESKEHLEIIQDGKDKNDTV